MNASTALAPLPIRTGDSWSAVTTRVEAYLRAHGLRGPGRISRLASDLVGIARARAEPGSDPMALAVATAETCLGAWLERWLPGDGTDDPTRRNRGRAALLLGEVPARWPEYFLRDGAMPADLVRVLRETDLGQTPEIHFTNMAPRAADQPARAAARPGWQVSYRWPFLRVVTGLVVVLSMLGVALVAGR